MEFKIGDKVKWKNYVGVIKKINSLYSVGVDFGESFDGHRLNGAISKDTGWFVNGNELKLYKKSNINGY